MWSVILKIAKRKFWKHKASTFTKLFCLSIGIISLFYIRLYMERGLGFDNFHEKKSGIFKVNTDLLSPTSYLQPGLSAVPLGPYLESVSPEIRDVVRISKESRFLSLWAGWDWQNLHTSSTSVGISLLYPSLYYSFRWLLPWGSRPYNW